MFCPHTPMRSPRSRELYFIRHTRPLQSSKTLGTRVLVQHIGSVATPRKPGICVLWRTDQCRVAQPAKGVVEYAKEIADLDSATLILFDPASNWVHDNPG
ncbi:hypothetical protein FHT44_006308 [Mycolicibacterium sp. BK634]|nr:hypothetical protein [Mycolicibacterium sp. BK634]